MSKTRCFDFLFATQFCSLQTLERIIASNFRLENIKNHWIDRKWESRSEEEKYILAIHICRGVGEHGIVNVIWTWWGLLLLFHWCRHPVLAPLCGANTNSIHFYFLHCRLMTISRINQKNCWIRASIWIGPVLRSSTVCIVPSISSTIIRCNSISAQKSTSADWRHSNWNHIRSKNQNVRPVMVISKKPKNVSSKLNRLKRNSPQANESKWRRLCPKVATKCWSNNDEDRWFHVIPS